MMRCTLAILALILLTPPTDQPPEPDARSEVDAAIERLRSADRAERAEGIRRLRQLGGDARRVWPSVVTFLDDPGLKIGERFSAQCVLEAIADPEDEAMSQAIVQVTLHRLAWDRKEAREVLWGYGMLCRHERQLGRVVPQLRAMLCLDRPADDDDLTRGLVLNLLARCGMDGFDTLTEAAGNRKFAHRSWAASPLGDFGESARPAVPVLRDCLDDANDLLERAERDGGDRRAAIVALGELGQGVSGVWEALRRLRGQVSPDEAATLALALWRTAPVEENDCQQWDGREEALVDLDSPLKRDDIPAFDAVCVIGPGAARLVPRLRATLNHSDAVVASWAAIALGEIGPSARSAVPRLWELANDPKQPLDTRTEAALAVARIDPARAEPAISLVCRETSLKKWKTIVWVVRFGPRARPAVSRLRELLTTPEAHVFEAAADALWRIDPDEARRLGVIRPAPRLGEEGRP